MEEEPKLEGDGEEKPCSIHNLRRKEKRKALKKMKRKELRKEAALKFQQEQEARLNDPEEQRRIRSMELEEEERSQRERKLFEERERAWMEAVELRNKNMAEEEEEEELRRSALEQESMPLPPQAGNDNEFNEEQDGWEYIEGPAEIIWKGEEIILKKKLIKVPKKDVQSDKGLEVSILQKNAHRPTSNPLPPQSEAFTDNNNASISSRHVIEDVANQVPNFGTEQDKSHCPFHLKTGACRFGQRCSRIHFYPDKSCTLLIKNMYNGPGLAWEQDEGLEFTDEEVERCYEEFYEDVHTELLKYGEIVNFKVCKNGAFHLRGNLYVHYKSLDSAVLAYNANNGRFYAGKQVICEFVNVTRWKIAICGEFMKTRYKTCSHGTACNFIHCFRNPGGDYEWADSDRPPPRYWVKKMASLFGYFDVSENEKYTELKHWDSHGNGRKSMSIDVDREHFHDSWSEIGKAVRMEVTSFGAITPLMPDRALMACENEEQASVLAAIQNWYKVGNFRVRFSHYSAEKMLANPQEPSYGGWIRVRDLPLESWTMETFKIIGEECGGLIEVAQKMLQRTDMMEVSLKVKQNPYGFIPAFIHLPSSSYFPIKVRIDPFFVGKNQNGYSQVVHGVILMKSNLDGNPRATSREWGNVMKKKGQAIWVRADKPPSNNSRGPPLFTDKGSVQNRGKEPSFSNCPIDAEDFENPSPQQSDENNQKINKKFDLNQTFDPSVELSLSQPSQVKSLDFGTKSLGIPIVINNRAHRLITGTIHSTNQPHSYSGTEGEICSSPGNTLHSERTLAIRQNYENGYGTIESYEEKEFEVEPIPLRMEPPDEKDSGKNRGSVTEWNSSLEADIPEEVASFLPYFFPWLAKRKLYIAPMPLNKGCSNTTKKQRNWKREVENLKTSINYYSEAGQKQSGESSHYR